MTSVVYAVEMEILAKRYAFLQIVSIVWAALTADGANQIKDAQTKNTNTLVLMMTGKRVPALIARFWEI